ncbi:hypothetical protein [Lentibacter sp. XHP0401]|uniref:hypothetical protein n=1 Tax=Lentibacter sp. XHP0401 TaxID=2984334 RepID=UPI0021E97D84|nr:hypothetical protein [Lentibacter sp. XHP0401]MCV2892225.1 hypothetical protein [Lentibacter sp. XHP0401]
MSFFDCVKDGLEDGMVDKARGERAQAMWRDISDRYERQGHERHVAEALAGEDVKEAFRKEAGKARHVLLSKLVNNRKQAVEVAGTTNRTDIRQDPTRAMERVDYRSRALKRRFDGSLQDYLDQHHQGLFGKTTARINHEKVLRSILDGDASDEVAAAYAKAVSNALEDMRLMANEAGATIGKIDNYFPQNHNRTALLEAGLDTFAKERGVGRRQAKFMAMAKGESRDAMFSRSFDTWADDIRDRIDWAKIKDHLTGRPFQQDGGPAPLLETQNRFLRDVFDSVVYGEGATSPTYGKPQGSSLTTRMSMERVLHFKSADDWIIYNKKYGTGDPHQALMSHVHKMARDITMMREFGPNPGLGLEFRGDLLMKRAKELSIDPRAAQGGVAQAKRMMAVENGAGVPNGYFQSLTANFLSDARQVMSSAFLDRAMIASISDVNFSKMAAQTIGSNRDAPFQVYIQNISDMAKNKSLTSTEMRQWGWVSDTMADAGMAVARFNGESPSSPWAANLSSSIMKLQGLSSHTDAGRFALQHTFAGQMANQIGRKFDDIEPGLLAIFKEHQITPDDWGQFANPEWAMKKPDGAMFLNPLWWREATNLPANVADDLFFKFQGAAEDFIESGVPTQSLFMRGIFDPIGRGLEPGSATYELAKSGLMFKSFVMAFSYNSYRVMRRMPSVNNRWLWAAENIAGATILGATALQITEIIKGNDPKPMDRSDFWFQAALKGGGFAIIGDIIATGETKWGGGVPSYAAGPVVQAAGDLYSLTIGNLTDIGISVLTGEEIELGLPKQLKRTIDRYMPGGDLPFLGPAFQRLITDQLYMALDPDGAEALTKKATARENRDGNGSFWMPGSPMPSRVPDFSNILGQ